MLDQTHSNLNVEVLDGLPMRLSAGAHTALMMVNTVPGYRKAELGKCEYRIFHIEIAGQLGHYEGHVTGEIGDDWREILANMSDEDVLNTFAADPTPASRTFLEELWRPCMAQFAPEVTPQHSPAPMR